MGQKAVEGDTTAARLIFQANGLIGSGGTEIHIGNRIGQQLNIANHLSIPRADNMQEWRALRKAMEANMAETAEAEAKAAAAGKTIDIEAVTEHDGAD